MFGVDSGYIRKIKAQQEEALKGLWKTEGNMTTWSQQGVEKLATFIKTPEAQKYLSSIVVTDVDQIERSHQQQAQQQQEVRTNSTNAIATRYGSAPQMIGHGIAAQMINNGAIEEIDRTVFETLLAGLKVNKPLNFDVSFDDEFKMTTGECSHCGAIVGSNIE